jgi:hypothetical protein
MACMTNGLERIAPGLMKLSSYSFAENVRHDLFAGLSVAAVALPVAVAYAQLAGFDPVVGLYSSILPLVAYAIFGTSRQLIVKDVHFGSKAELSARVERCPDYFRNQALIAFL